MAGLVPAIHVLFDVATPKDVDARDERGHDEIQRNYPMQTPREILADIWTSAGGDPSALDTVTLTGEEPQLPSSFRVAATAQVSIAASGLAAAEIWKLRSGQNQSVAVDMSHAV